jgi:NADH-quinone oxidoreductase subunit A
VLDAERPGRRRHAKVGPGKVETTYRAPLVIAADGSSARLALALGIAKRDDRPMGVAVRRYFESPRHDDDMLESWLELRGEDGSLLPGYGWVFGVGDGTSNVGLGILNTTNAWQKTDYKDLLGRWTGGMPGSGSSTTSTRPARSRRRAADGLQPHAPLQPRRACSSATPAARSTRSTARASPTPWSRGCWRPRPPRRHCRPAGPGAGARAAGLSELMKDAYGGYFTPSAACSWGDRPPAGDARGDQVRPPPSAAHEVHAEAARQPHRSPRRRRPDRVINGLVKVAPAALTRRTAGACPRPAEAPASATTVADRTTCPLCPVAPATRPGGPVVLNNYVPLLVMFVLAFGFVVVSVVSAALIGPKRYNRAKLDAYECGIEPTPQPMGGGRFPVKFYLTAMLFIVFDIEMVFLIPWAVAFDSLGLFGLVEMALFIGTVFVAYAYVWRRGGLEWD